MPISRKKTAGELCNAILYYIDDGKQVFFQKVERKMTSKHANSLTAMEV
jgi:hypothetical protein